jgi:uncharacterized protein YecT (DUF1311 family)
LPPAQSSTPDKANGASEAAPKDQERETPRLEGRKSKLLVGAMAFCIIFSAAIGVVQIFPSQKTAPVAIPIHAASTAKLDVISPSFNCDGVHSNVLKLVCSTPSLAEADRKLADAYVIALSRVHSKRRLRANENAWIIRRNNSPTNVSILQRMYKERTDYLIAKAAN